jgi:hypothetical protein
MQIKDITHYRMMAGVLCVLLMGCGSDPGDTMNKAEQVADGYFQALKSKDLEKAAGFFIETRSVPRAQRLDELRDYNSKLGELQSYQLVNEEMDSGTTVNRYTLRYKTQYTKASAYETLVVFIPDIPFVASHNHMQIGNLIIQSKGR